MMTIRSTPLDGRMTSPRFSATMAHSPRFTAEPPNPPSLSGAPYNHAPDASSRLIRQTAAQIAGDVTKYGAHVAKDHTLKQVTQQANTEQAMTGLLLLDLNKTRKIMDEKWLLRNLATGETLPLDLSEIKHFDLHLLRWVFSKPPFNGMVAVKGLIQEGILRVKEIRKAQAE